jgi:hypothetical protein
VSAEARDLFTRAEMLAETGDLAEVTAEVLAGAERSGADPGVVAGLIAAIRALDPAMAVQYNAGSPSDRRRNTGYRSEWEFLEAAGDAGDQIGRRCREAETLDAASAALLDAALDDLDTALDDLDTARGMLSAAYAMGTHEPCTGCHGAKHAAITEAETAVAAAEAAILDAREAIGICEAAAEILTALTGVLRSALTRVRRVPADLGEVYELVHTFIRNGGKLPDYARFIEGTTCR